MIFAVEPYLVTPYRPLTGALSKHDAIRDTCLAHPARFLVSPRSGDPGALIAHTLADPANAAWEVWRGGTLVGILWLDRIVAGIDARLQFAFFDDELGSKEPLLQAFIARCYADFGLVRLTTEVPECMSNLIGFVRRKLGFRYEGETHAPASVARRGSRRERAYWDGTRWHDIMVLRHLGEE
jgi:hypothetical protein